MAVKLIRGSGASACGRGGGRRRAAAWPGAADVDRGHDPGVDRVQGFFSQTGTGPETAVTGVTGSHRFCYRLV